MPGITVETARMRQAEAERGLGSRSSGDAEVVDDRVHALGDLPLAVAGEVEVAEVALGERRLGRDRPGQAALVERHAGEDADVVLAARGEELVLRALVEDVVDHLHGVDEARATSASAVSGWWSLIETPKQRILPACFSPSTASSQSPCSSQSSSRRGAAAGRSSRGRGCAGSSRCRRDVVAGERRRRPGRRPRAGQRRSSAGSWSRRRRLRPARGPSWPTSCSLWPSP